MVSPLRTESNDATARAAARPAIPPTPGVIVADRRFESSRVAVMLALVAYGGVGVFAEWWPIGWLNLAQQSLAGSYSVKLSVLGFVTIAVVVQALAWAAVQGIVTRRIAAADIAAGRLPASAGASAGTFASATVGRVVAKPAMSQSRLLVRMGVGTVVVIWIAAAAAFFWFDTQQRRDNEAVYVPFRVGGDESARVAMGDHVSIEGEVLASRVVTHRTDSNSVSPSFYVIPVVPLGWRPGEATHVLLQVEHPSTLPGYGPSTPQRPWILPEMVLGRVGTGASVIAGKEFENMGVPLAPDYKLLEVVPSQAGKPIQSHVDYLERVLWFAGVGSIVMAFVYVASFFIVRRRERIELARKATVVR